MQTANWLLFLQGLHLFHYKRVPKKIIGMRPFGHLLINKIQKEKQQQAQKEALQT